MKDNKTVTDNETATATVNETVNPNVGKPCLLARCHDVTAFASTNKSMYVLQGVHINAAKLLVEATDGRMAIRVPVCEGAEDFPPVKSAPDACEDVIVPVAPYVKALKNSGNGDSALPILACVRVGTSRDKADEPAKVTLTASDLETEQAVMAKTLEARFPNLDMVWPTDKPTLTIALGSDLLKQLATYAQAHGKDVGSLGGLPITLRFTDALSAVRASFTVTTPLGDVQAEAVLMPMRVA